jgi:Subtilase family
MSDLPHLQLEGTASSVPYTYAGGGRSVPFRLPPRDRGPHAQRLAGELRRAEGEVVTIRGSEPPVADEIDGVPITIRSDAGYELPLESLDRTRDRIELLSVKVVAGVTVAALFVPRDKILNLLRKIDDYEKENSTRKLKNGTTKVSPKNKNLIESIASIRLLAVEDLWQDDPELYPAPDQQIWWEVWGRRGAHEDPGAAYERLRSIVQGARAIPSIRFVYFPERVVGLVYGSARQLGASLDFLSDAAELRRAKEVPGAYLNLAAGEQRQFVAEVLGRLQPPSEDAPAVCLLDTGVNRDHPLLAPALSVADWQAVDPSWQAADHDQDQHGTGMAGIALYRCLTDVFNSQGPIQLRHRLESVKLLPPPPLTNAPEVYGAVTQQAVAKAEVSAPGRNRAICMAVTTDDDRDDGFPSSWSAAVDQMCAGEVDGNPKLLFISTGNYREAVQNSECVYPEWNRLYAGVEDPSQAWNAVTVGGYTDLVTITDPIFANWNPIAPAGDLSPTSRTSGSWAPESQAGWPIKPDIVMEAGNYVTDGVTRSSCEDLSLLTTVVHPTGRQLTSMRDTSAATAAAARIGALIWSQYPRLRPETVRALIVHSARWTPAMLRRFVGGEKSVVQQRLRCYGYGVPNLGRALYSAENAATLLYEGELQPFEANPKGGQRTKEMHLHELPWPKAALEGLGNTQVKMHVTLSYFVEPSPGRKGWGRKFRFQSHGLRFEVKSPVETVGEFKKRISRAVWEENEGRPDNVAELPNWIVGAKGRTHGSIHSDWWEGDAAKLAASGHVAIYPVTGWWRERPQLGRLESKARYSLIISLETPDEEVDLYHAIESLATVTAEVEF